MNVNVLRKRFSSSVRWGLGVASFKVFFKCSVTFFTFYKLVSVVHLGKAVKPSWQCLALNANGLISNVSPTVQHLSKMGFWSVEMRQWWHVHFPFYLFWVELVASLQQTCLAVHLAKWWSLQHMLLYFCCGLWLKRVIVQLFVYFVNFSCSIFFNVNGSEEKFRYWLSLLYIVAIEWCIQGHYVFCLAACMTFQCLWINLGYVDLPFLM